MRLRRLLFWLHLAAGVLAGLVILLMSITGVVLTYERQLIAWADRDVRSLATGGRRLPVGELLGRVAQQDAALTPTAITVASDPSAPVALAAGARTLLVDAYSGRVLAESAPSMRRFMSQTRAWHRWLARDGDSRQRARAITGWSNLLFLFIVMSGPYLWLPRNWSSARLRAGLLFNTRARGKARDFNWHNVIGVWSAVPLFVIVLCAVPMSFPWANALVYRAAGDAPPQQGGRGGGAGPGRQREADGAGESRRDRGAGRDRASDDALEAGLREAERQVPGWTTINLRLPASPAARLVLAIDRGDGGQPQLRSTLTLAAATGAVVSHERFSDLSPGRQARSAMRFLHTGEFFGLTGQTIAGIATTGAVLLVCTGLLLSIRRLGAWLARRRTAVALPVRSSAA
jgi:uncharacterized iron-regulated membrane protein